MYNSHHNLPECLNEIWQQIQDTNASVDSNEDDFKLNWLKYAQHKSKEISSVQVKDKGETVFSGALSRGCKACKEGKWDCVFMTMQCNLNCNFCCSPNQQKTRAMSFLGNDLNSIMNAYRKTGIQGVSFSGGEAMLSFDQTLNWLKTMKRNLPDIYYWLYTNGMIMNPSHIHNLRTAGLNEIRFNMAACGYMNKEVLEKIKFATKRGIICTVEIPAIWTDLESLIEALPYWVEAGVKHLNLHELMRIENSNSSELQGEYTKLVNSDGYKSEVSVDSKNLIFEIFRKVEEQRIPIHINACSLSNKIGQVQGRRKNLAQLSRQKYEKIVDEVKLQTIFQYRNEGEHGFVHPDEYFKEKEKYSESRIFSLTRLANLSVKEDNKYIELEELT